MFEFLFHPHMYSHYMQFYLIAKHILKKKKSKKVLHMETEAPLHRELLELTRGQKLESRSEWGRAGWMKSGDLNLSPTHVQKKKDNKGNTTKNLFGAEQQIFESQESRVSYQSHQPLMMSQKIFKYNHFWQFVLLVVMNRAVTSKTVLKMTPVIQIWML